MPQYKILGGKTYKTGIPAKVIGKTVMLPTAPAKPVDPYGSLWKIAQAGVQTPAQIAALANSQALATEKGMLAAQKAISDQTIAQYNNQATRAEGFAGALGKLQAGEDQEAFARYGQSADRLAGIGAGLTGAVGAGYQSGVDRTREAVANLTGGLGKVTATPGADIANAAQYMGATAPARTLEESAANAARLAQSDAAARAQNLHHIGEAYTTKADDAIAQAASDARALIAKRPSTIAELVNQLTTNRQTGISNLAGVLNARTSYKQAEAKRATELSQRAEDMAQRAIENERATRQLDISEQGIETSQRIQLAGLLGKDPLTGMPSFSREQWDAQTDQAKKSYAATQSSQLGYQVDWQTGLPRVVNGHVVPNANYKLDPKNPYAVLPIFKPGSRAGGTVVGGTGGLKPGEWASLQQAGQETVKDLMTGKPPEYDLINPQYDDDGEPRPGTGKYVQRPGTGVAAADYPTLRNALLQLNDSPRWQARALQIANSKFGPGQGGRPWGSGPEARSYITTAVRSAKQHRVDYAEVLHDLKQMGLPQKLVERELRKQFGPTRTWGARPAVGDAGSRGGGADLKTPGTSWDEGNDPIDPTYKAPWLGPFRTKSGRWVQRQGTATVYVDGPS